jgi:predicted DNA-binding helix-hairpin-helix protein
VDSDIVRLNALSEQMQFEPAEDLSLVGSTYGDNLKRCPDEVYVHPAILPNGQKIKLLKTLLTSACERDCFYCAFRAGRDYRRATFQPEEFARLFMMLQHKGITEGLFLSSGMVGGGLRTQDKLLDTAEILRRKLGFRGYIHLKIIPGAEYAQVEHAMQLANRVSINLEAPNTARLRRLAPHKQFSEELLQVLKWMHEIRRSQSPQHSWNGHWPSSVTQFVTGGAGESDLELMTVTDYLFRNLGLKRTYYSPFSPVPGTPLENQEPLPPVREKRLYQASFLLRDYGFDLEELPFEKTGLLPIDKDPKQAWADEHLSEKPVDINHADRLMLLRIPGIGLKGAERIISARHERLIRDVSTLQKMGIRIERATPFLLLSGKRPSFQPRLFQS